MRKIVFLLLSVLIYPACIITLSAQDKKMDMADFEKRKMEYVKKEAGLTQGEANKYFPLNNELTKKKFDLHKKHRDKMQRIKENSKISDDEYKNMLEEDVDMKLKEAALDKEYAKKFKKVLSPEKLFKAQEAERIFIQKEVTRFRKDQGNKRKR